MCGRQFVGTRQVASWGPLLVQCRKGSNGGTHLVVSEVRGAPLVQVLRSGRGPWTGPTVTSTVPSGMLISHTTVIKVLG